MLTLYQIDTVLYHNIISNTYTLGKNYKKKGNVYLDCNPGYSYCTLGVKNVSGLWHSVYTSNDTARADFVSKINTNLIIIL